MSGFRFTDMSSTGWAGNCQICGEHNREHPRETVLKVEWWSETPDLPALLLLCAEHAEQLAHYCVALENLPHIYTKE